MATLSASGMKYDLSMTAPSRLAVMRPWPMPSVIEEPSEASLPVV